MVEEKDNKSTRTHGRMLLSFQKGYSHPIPGLCALLTLREGPNGPELISCMFFSCSRLSFKQI